ncbi:pentapeptide repeat-containing protein [Chloroflexota bacterium]
MGDGTRENPFTRGDVLRLIQENGGTAEKLDLSGKWFEKAIHLAGMGLNKIILRNAHLNGAHLDASNLQYANMVKCELKGAHLEKSDLRYSRLSESRLQGAQLQEANLLRTRLDKVYLHDIEFSYETNFVRAYWGDFIIGEERSGQFLRAGDIYRRLKVWYANSGMHDIVGFFFYREQEAHRKSIQKEIVRLFKTAKYRELLRYLFKPRGGWSLLWSWVYRSSCGYGEKPWRVILWGLLVLLGLTLIYFLFRGVAPYTLTLSALWSSLYYSAVSFTALGYGSWFGPGSVSAWAQGFGAAEAIIGVFLITLFLVTFTRKMRR